MGRGRTDLWNCVVTVLFRCGEELIYGTVWLQWFRDMGRTDLLNCVVAVLFRHEEELTCWTVWLRCLDTRKN